MKQKVVKQKSAVSPASQPALKPLSRAIRNSLLGAGMGLITCTSHAATIVVTSNADGNDMCTLREALGVLQAGAEANGCINSSGNDFGTDDTITFSGGGEIILGGSELAVNSDVTIDASSVSGVTINANKLSRVFNLAQNTTVTMDSLTITGGETVGSGGGIYLNEGSSLQIDNSSVSGNISGEYGGGLFLFSGNTLTANATRFNSNQADQDGGAIYLQSDGDHSIYLIDSIINNNRTINDEGGGIWSSGSGNYLSLSNTVMVGNSAGNEGGAVFIDGADSVLSISGGEISNNFAGQYENHSPGASPSKYCGGGIHVYSYAGATNLIELIGATISGNSSNGGGGGISVLGGSSDQCSNGGPILKKSTNSQKNRSRVEQKNAQKAQAKNSLLSSKLTGLEGLNLRVINSRINSNLGGAESVGNRGHGAGILSKYSTVEINGGQISNNSQGFYGGGIAAFNSEVTITAATISGNSSVGDGGGVYTNGSTLNVTRSTVSSNRAGVNRSHEGGGIWSSGGYLYVDNSTISGNSVFQRGGGIWTEASSTSIQNSTIANNETGVSDQGGGLYIAGNSVTISNSIIADSLNGGDCAGTYNYLVMGTDSIVEDGSCDGLARSGDPALRPLAANGGPTLTHALTEGSIAVNTGDAMSCLPTDQRGFSRSDGRCDVGAFEADFGGFFVIPTPDGKVIVVPE